jgi:hypothetical protein
MVFVLNGIDSSDILKIGIEDGMTQTDVYAIYSTLGLDMFGLVFYIIITIKIRKPLNHYIQHLAESRNNEEYGKVLAQCLFRFLKKYSQ